MTKEQMIEKAIQKLGCENELVIAFAKLCEDYPSCSWWHDAIIKIWFDYVMSVDVFDVD